MTAVEQQLAARAEALADATGFECCDRSSRDLLRDLVAALSAAAEQRDTAERERDELAATAYAYTSARGWAPIGDDYRCTDCNAHIDHDDHRENCRYEALHVAAEAIVLRDVRALATLDGGDGR